MGRARTLLVLVAIALVGVRWMAAERDERSDRSTAATDGSERSAVDLPTTLIPAAVGSTDDSSRSLPEDVRAHPAAEPRPVEIDVVVVDSTYGMPIQGAEVRRTTDASTWRTSDEGRARVRAHLYPDGIGGSYYEVRADGFASREVLLAERPADGELVVELDPRWCAAVRVVLPAGVGSRDLVAHFHAGEDPRQRAQQIRKEALRSDEVIVSEYGAWPLPDEATVCVSGRGIQPTRLPARGLPSFSDAERSAAMLPVIMLGPARAIECEVLRPNGDPAVGCWIYDEQRTLVPRCSLEPPDAVEGRRGNRDYGAAFRTDEAGRARIEPLPAEAGTVHMRVAAQDGAFANIEFDPAIDEGALLTVRLQDPERGSIRGHFTFRPLGKNERIYVSASRSEGFGGRRVQLEPDGSFEIDGLPVGTYAISARLSVPGSLFGGNRTLSESVQVETGTDHVELMLLPTEESVRLPTGLLNLSARPGATDAR